jgi:hypothetical protein
MSFKGSPLTATMSAHFPASIVPTLSLQPRSSAGAKISTEELQTTREEENLKQEGGKLRRQKQIKLCEGIFDKGQTPNRSAARALAFAASTARSLGGALVSSSWRRRAETAAISSTAARKRAWFIFDGLWIPLIFRTNCREDACISSGVTGGSKLKSVFMFLHMD